MNEREQNRSFQIVTVWTREDSWLNGNREKVKMKHTHTHTHHHLPPTQ